MGKLESVISKIGSIAFMSSIIAYSLKLIFIAYALIIVFGLCLATLFIKELPNIIKYLKK